MSHDATVRVQQQNPSSGNQETVSETAASLSAAPETGFGMGIRATETLRVLGDVVWVRYSKTGEGIAQLFRSCRQSPPICR